MTKIIKLFLAFSLLFSCATYHQNANAGIIKDTVIATTILTAFYLVANLYADSVSASDSLGSQNIKRDIKKVINFIDNVSLDTNNSINKNFGLDINKYRKKLVAVGLEATLSVLENIEPLLTQKEDKKNARKLKLGIRKKQLKNGDFSFGTIFGTAMDYVTSKQEEKTIEN